ncbi:unnamed protein product, partial [Protopolystoma xenopodis]
MIVDEYRKVKQTLHSTCGPCTLSLKADHRLSPAPLPLEPSLAGGWPSERAVSSRARMLSNALNYLNEKRKRLSRAGTLPNLRLRPDTPVGQAVQMVGASPSPSPSPSPVSGPVSGPVSEPERRNAEVQCCLDGGERVRLEGKSSSPVVEAGGGRAGGLLRGGRGKSWRAGGKATRPGGSATTSLSGPTSGRASPAGGSGDSSRSELDVELAGLVVRPARHSKLRLCRTLHIDAPSAAATLRGDSVSVSVSVSPSPSTSSASASASTSASRCVVQWLGASLVARRAPRSPIDSADLDDDDGGGFVYAAANGLGQPRHAGFGDSPYSSDGELARPPELRTSAGGHVKPARPRASPRQAGQTSTRRRGAEQATRKDDAGEEAGFCYRSSVEVGGAPSRTERRCVWRATTPDSWLDRRSRLDGETTGPAGPAGKATNGDGDGDGDLEVDGDGDGEKRRRFSGQCRWLAARRVSGRRSNTTDAICLHKTDSRSTRRQAPRLAAKGAVAAKQRRARSVDERSRRASSQAPASASTLALTLAPSQPPPPLADLGPALALCLNAEFATRLHPWPLCDPPADVNVNANVDASPPGPRLLQHACPAVVMATRDTIFQSSSSPD